MLAALAAAFTLLQEELASVLGHETGHVAARRSVAFLMMTRARAAQIEPRVGRILSSTPAECSGAAAGGLR